MQSSGAGSGQTPHPGSEGGASALCLPRSPVGPVLCRPWFFLLSGEGQAFRHVKVFGRPDQRGLSSLPRSPGLQTQATPLGASPRPRPAGPRGAAARVCRPGLSEGRGHGLHRHGQAHGQRCPLSPSTLRRHVLHRRFPLPLSHEVGWKGSPRLWTGAPQIKGFRSTDPPARVGFSMALLAPSRFGARVQSGVPHARRAQPTGKHCPSAAEPCTH